MDAYFDYLAETDDEYYQWLADHPEMLTARIANDELGMMVYYGDKPLCNYGNHVSPERAIYWFRREFGSKPNKAQLAESEGG